MTDQIQLEIIRDNPIGKGLDAFRDRFNQICTEKNKILATPDAITQLDQAAAGQLHAKTGRDNLRTSLLRLVASVSSNNNVDLNYFQPLLNLHRPPPLKASSIEETPWSHKTSSLVNTSEYRDHINAVLKQELSSFFVDIQCFREKLFQGVPDLEATSEVVFQQCKEGSDPLFGSQGGWSGWPVGADEADVLRWFRHILVRLEALAAQNCNSAPTTCRRKLLARPRKPLPGSTAKRSLDIGFINDDLADDTEQENYNYTWSHVLVPGGLKSNLSRDTASVAWADLAKYAREVLSAQEICCFVLGFTLCGSIMRFDINQDGKQFISTILGFLWMSEAELGFDPTIKSEDGKQYIEIKRNGAPERLILDGLMHRTRCIVGRATIAGRPIAKDTQRRHSSSKTLGNTPNAMRRVDDADDNIQNNVRRGLDITSGKEYQLGRGLMPPPQSSLPRNTVASTASKGDGGSSSKNVSGKKQPSGTKRSSSQTGAPLPPSKRHISRASLAKTAGHKSSDRVHRRVVLLDYGKPIYKASSRSALVAALRGCIDGHESLYKAGILHRDISINNLMINEDDKNPSFPSFLIDLDLAIRLQRDGASGARDRTGTRAFMAIGALRGEQHSFMHDLESFFWVLFWICIHHDGPQKSRVVDEFDEWNYTRTEHLVKVKIGIMGDEPEFMDTITNNFTQYCAPLIGLMTKLRETIFPGGKRWIQEDKGLYSRIRNVFVEWEDSA
ncbi:serine/threonine-protein kinase Sgk2 [Trichoderma austrokoningii]